MAEQKEIDYPKTIDELLNICQKKAKKGISQDRIINYVYAVNTHHGIRIRHDQHEIPRPIKIKKKKKGFAAAATQLPVTYKRQKDGSHHMTITFDPEIIEDQPIPVKDMLVSRLVFSIDRKKRDSAKAPIYYESNGLVIDAIIWKVISKPTPVLTHLNKQVEEYLGAELYDIYAVHDGTMVTLYSWDHPIKEQPIWCIASSNGYDVSELYWLGSKSYAEIVFESLGRYEGFAETTKMTFNEGRLDFANLDRTKCYTIGFRHHNFHPLIADPECVWQLNGELPIIPQQLPLDICVSTIAQLSSNFANCIEEAIGGKFNYGYILKSKNAQLTLNNSNIIIDSPLLHRIRKLMYERAPLNDRMKLTTNDRMEYNAIRMFLSTNSTNFLQLYPVWRDRFVLYARFADKVIELINFLIRQTETPILNTPAGVVANLLLVHINKYDKLEPFNKNTEKIIKDHVMNPEYAYLFMKAISKTNFDTPKSE